MLIVFNWSISKAYGYEGQNVCTMRVEGKKVSGCVGGNYDMPGTCLRLWMNKYFINELIKFKYNGYGKSEFEGLRLYHNVPNLDGCGWDELTKILKKLGYCLEFGYKNYRVNEYILKEVIT